MSEHDLRMEIVSLRQLLEKAEARDRDVVSGQAYMVLVGQLADAVEALEWIERFTSDRGDARMMDAGQARAHIHRRAASALKEE